MNSILNQNNTKKNIQYHKFIWSYSYLILEPQIRQLIKIQMIPKKLFAHKKTGPSLTSLLQHFEKYPSEDYTLNFCQNFELLSITKEKQVDKALMKKSKAMLGQILLQSANPSCRKSESQDKRKQFSSQRVPKIEKINHMGQMTDSRQKVQYQNLGSKVKAKVSPKQEKKLDINSSRRLTYGEGQNYFSETKENKMQNEMHSEISGIAEKVERTDRYLKKQFQGFSNKISEAKAEIAQYLKAYNERQEGRKENKKQRDSGKSQIKIISEIKSGQNESSRGVISHLELNSQISSKQEQKNSQYSQFGNQGVDYSFAENFCESSESKDERIGQVNIPEILQVFSEQYPSRNEGKTLNIPQKIPKQSPFIREENNFVV